MEVHHISVDVLRVAPFSPEGGRWWTQHKNCALVILGDNDGGENVSQLLRSSVLQGFSTSDSVPWTKKD